MISAGPLPDLSKAISMPSVEITFCMLISLASIYLFDTYLDDLLNERCRQWLVWWETNHRVGRIKTQQLFLKHFQGRATHDKQGDMGLRRTETDQIPVSVPESWHARADGLLSIRRSRSDSVP